jgi:hypothetical protein
MQCAWKLVVKQIWKQKDFKIFWEINVNWQTAMEAKE